MNLFETGIRPAIDAHLLAKSQGVRDYGEYWSASSAGYCMRKCIFDRLKVPKVKDDARKMRVFEVGHIFHEWIQRVTKEAGISVAQELELQDEGLMVRGHIDDLVLVGGVKWGDLRVDPDDNTYARETVWEVPPNLILYDYKTQNSRAFSFQKDRPMSHYHKMQLGTYMYMLRMMVSKELPKRVYEAFRMHARVEEGRILKISKDDLRLSEQQLMWSPELEKEVVQYWTTLNGYWKNKQIPKCTCADREGGFLAREAYNDYFYAEQPCSVTWLVKCHNEGKVDIDGWKVNNEKGN